MRFVLAATHVHYYMLAGEENAVNPYEWKKIVDRQLLTEEEKGIVEAYKGMKQFLLITWALQEVKAALSVTDGSGSNTNGSGTNRMFIHVAFELRGHCGQMTPTEMMLRSKASASPPAPVRRPPVSACTPHGRDR